MIVPRRRQLILIVALTITVIWILSAEKIIPEIWSIILSASVTVSGTVVAFWPLIFPASDGPGRVDTSPQIPSKHRADLLKSIERVWNTDFFQENPARRVYYPAGILPLELHLQEGRLEELLLQNPPDSTGMRRDSTKITEIYEKAKDDGLLILGGPGSGKTTLLLDLAKDLLAKAKVNEELPIPVVLSLSSWVSQQQTHPLKEWLVEALRTTYQSSTRMWKLLLEKKSLLFLFDGLDELALEAQPACIEAINNFSAQYLYAPVVSSRTEEYLKHVKQKKYLQILRTAVTIQPLTYQKIEEWLSTVEVKKVEGLRTVLQEHERLQKIIEAPLVLNMLMDTYDGLEAETIRPLIEKLSSNNYNVLFHDYVQRMLQPTEKWKKFTKESARHWLMWLALQLTQPGRDVFYLEKLQREWLPKEILQQLRDNPSMRVRQAAGENQHGISLFSRLLYWLLSRLLQWSNGRITPREVPNWKWKGIPRAFRYQWEEIPRAFHYLLWKELPQNDPWYILTNSELHVSIGKVGEEPQYKIMHLHYDPWYFLISAGLLPALVGVTTGLFAGLSYGLSYGLLFGLLITLIWFLLFQGAMSVVLAGSNALDFTSFKDTARAHPNQGIWRSGRHGLLLGLLLGLFGGLVGALAGALLMGSLLGLTRGPLYNGGWRNMFIDPLSRLQLGLVGGALLGLLVGPICLFLGLRYYGGLAWLQHMLLRLLLWSTNCTPRPWRYVAFLDEAVERRLLCKRGGGYVFRHRMLQDYFASLEHSSFAETAQASSFPASPNQSPGPQEDIVQ